MNTKPENIVKIGNAILTPDAIVFLESLQYENNAVLKEYSKTMSELVSGVLVLTHQGDAAPNVIKRIKDNAAELATLAFDIERLFKP